MDMCVVLVLLIESALSGFLHRGLVFWRPRCEQHVYGDCGSNHDKCTRGEKNRSKRSFASNPLCAPKVVMIPLPLSATLYENLREVAPVVFRVSTD